MRLLSANNWNVSTSGSEIAGVAGPTGTVGACYSYDLAIGYTLDSIAHTARGKINGAFE